MLILSVRPAFAADETVRFIAACGKPDRDVTVSDRLMPPERTLYYYRGGFIIVFDLPKQPQGPLPAANDRWRWPTVNPPYQWQYSEVEKIDSRGIKQWACAPETIVPYCHITVPEECRRPDSCQAQWCGCQIPPSARRCAPPPMR